MEHVAQMGPMWITAGLLIGWIAQAAWRAGAYGLMTDMVLGVVGASAVGAAVGAVGPHLGMLSIFALGAAGAAVLVVAQRGLWHPARVGLVGTTVTPAMRRAS